MPKQKPESLNAPENPRFNAFLKQVDKGRAVREQVIDDLKANADEEKCADASRKCYYDRESGRIFARCEHADECLEEATKNNKKVKVAGVTPDNELFVSNKPLRPIGVSQKAKDNKAEKDLQDLSVKVQTKQQWNEEFQCWETVIVED